MRIKLICLFLFLSLAGCGVSIINEESAIEDATGAIEQVLEQYAQCIRQGDEEGAMKICTEGLPPIQVSMMEFPAPLNLLASRMYASLSMTVEEIELTSETTAVATVQLTMPSAELLNRFPVWLQKNYADQIPEASADDRAWDQILDAFLEEYADSESVETLYFELIQEESSWRINFASSREKYVG